MQQIKDLEARLDQLASENRALVEAKIVAEQHLEQAHFEQNRSENTTSGFTAQLQERDAEIARLKQEVADLIATHESLRREHEEGLLNLRQEHDQAQSQWQDSSRELETLRSRHTELSTGMETIVRHEIDTALAEKNTEIQRLRSDLEVAREKIRDLQSQILARPMDDVVVLHDEDYFDQACQKLCQQVQGWVLRFSKFSDLKLCRSTNEVRDEKIVDRFDNAILDGSDVDTYLADRVRRRDVFMSVVMTMIWEYVFTRYLFGMDREQRQKLKLLEKNLGEVGQVGAVHQWRALTLTLLSKRESFKAQKESDTEAVAIEIFSTLSRFLPPPQNLEEQIVGSLRNVMRTAVDLSIEMRTQRAEYIMLPPLQPEYDTNGDLARKVYFNASLMNERSGETTNNEDLEREQAVVRMVLFPLVVKKGDDDGVGDDEIVVCPAQVLIARPDKGKKPRGSNRLASGGSDAKSLRAISTHSLAMSGIEGNENMF
jgi:archaellum component FlaC